MEQLEPLLPALQQHLALAVATIKEPPEGAGEELLTTGKRVAGSGGGGQCLHRARPSI